MNDLVLNVEKVNRLADRFFDVISSAEPGTKNLDVMAALAAVAASEALESPYPVGWFEVFATTVARTIESEPFDLLDS
jgi:hypothetical protein